jgi:alpha,alpha-trehalose phosphorylase
MLDGLSWSPDGWTLREDQLRTVEEATGVLFTTSNGYVGVAGGRREPFGTGAVLVSGLMETRPYAHPERSYGIPERYQTLVTVTDPTGVAVTVDAVPVTTASGTWELHDRTLDLHTGCVMTVGQWCSPRGPTVRVRTRRFASLTERALLWTSTEVEAVDADVTVKLTTTLRANTGDRTFPDEPEALTRAWGRIFRPRGRVERDPVIGLVHAAALSGRAIATATAAAGDGLVPETTVDDDEARRTYAATIRPGEVVAVSQRAAFVDGHADDSTRVLETAAATVNEVAGRTFEDALAEQRRALDEFWTAADVGLAGAAEVERAVRYSTFQVLQSSILAGGRALPAKGLSGQGYEGHHLWEQEIYVNQVLTLLAPQAARDALSFRVTTLPHARRRAAEMGFRGAQYPWRTIDGSEASSFFPAGAAQHHVNADIAWSIDHYVACTGDDGFLTAGGLEIMVETARFWMSVGRFDVTGQFRIDGVTGPDEYTALVDNNLYTNLMAARNLASAAEHLEELRRTASDEHRRLIATVGLEPTEPGEWRRAADAVDVPFDRELQVHAQNDGFLEWPRWDLEATPSEEFPLQDHHHLLTLYRHQVLKQADVVLALFLLADRFSPEQRRRDFDYYEPVTSHDSSLSAPIHAVVAADVGRLDLAWHYTDDATMTDLGGRRGALADGLHRAAAAGSWLAVACGFGGFRIRDGRPAFRPQLPPDVTCLRFGLRWRDAVLSVTTDDDRATSYELRRGPRFALWHHDEVVHLTADQPVQQRPPVDPAAHHGASGRVAERHE